MCSDIPGIGVELVYNFIIIYLRYIGVCVIRLCTFTRCVGSERIVENKERITTFN